MVYLCQPVRTLLLAVILFIPLAPAVFGLGFEAAKVLVLILLLSGVFLILVFRRLTMKEKFVQKLTWPLKMGLLFVGILFLSSVLGVDPATSFLGVYPYYQGWVIYAFLWVFSLLFFYSGINLKKVSYCLTASSLFVSLSAINEWVQLAVLHENIPTYAGRVVSTFGQPNLYAGFLLLTLPFSVRLIKLSSKWRYAYLVCTGLNISAIIISQSKTATFLMVCLLFYVMYKANTVVVRALLLFLAAAIFIFFVYYFYPVLWKETGEPNTIHITDFTPERRVYIWPIFFQLVAEKPLLGYGLDNIGAAYSSYFENFNITAKQSNPYYLSLRDILVNRAHNYFLDILLYSGFLGLVSFLAMLFLCFKKTRAEEIRLFFILFVAWSFFQIPSIAHLLLFWLNAGLANQDTVNGD